MNPNIKERMLLITSCGHSIGAVDHLEGEQIAVTMEGGQHHYIPADWVARVDNMVRLNKNVDEVKRGWKTEAVGAR